MQAEEKVGILLVDDRRENLLALEAVLSDLGQYLVRARSGEEALRLLLRDEFAAILLDAQMPGMDGFQTAALIREQPKSKDTPIIFITAAYESDRYRFQGYSVGAVDYILKPFEPEVLKAKVRVFVDLFKKTRILKDQWAVLRKTSVELVESKEKIERLNVSLEQRVTERTAELEAANKRLESEIRERKQAEQAVAESERNFRMVLETTVSAVFIYQGPAFRYVNKATEAITGYTRDELLAMNFWDLVHPDFRELIRGRGLARQRGEPVPSQYEAKIMTKSKAERWVEFTAAPISFEGKAAALGTAYDITERKRIEGERIELLAREQEARAQAEAAHLQFRFLAEASAVLASSLDYETTLTNVARLAVPRFADWCAVEILEKQESIRQLAVAHADPAKADWARDLGLRYPVDPNAAHGVAHVLRTGWSEIYPEISDSLLVETARNAEHLKMLRDLNPRSAIVVPLIAHGRTFGALTFVSAKSGRIYGPADLSLAEELGRRAGLAVENARLYREAQEASRLKDEFLATVSHELRTPLTSILGWTRMLNTQALNQSDYSRALETIERNARSQVQLIEDLLDVSRIITGKLRLDVRSIEPALVIETALDALRPAADAKGIRLQVVLDPKAGPIPGDPDRLQQVVWNLVSNAIKFTPKEGRVQVRLERINSHIEITVSDTGVGINPEFLPYVFDRFRQANSTTTRAHGGLGLGLAIVRHLVELHGGTVHAESAGPGGGATFTIKLPLMVVHATADLRDREHPTASSQSIEKNYPRLDGLRVLVVDDEPDTCEMVATVLERCQAVVKKCTSAAVALDILQEWKPHVLISDIEMPEQDGYTFLRKVRELEPQRGGQTPAAALTAYARVEDRLRALSAGYQIHIAKPVEPIELATVVASLAGRTGKLEISGTT